MLAGDLAAIVDIPKSIYRSADIVEELSCSIRGSEGYNGWGRRYRLVLERYVLSFLIEMLPPNSVLSCCLSAKERMEWFYRRSLTVVLYHSTPRYDFWWNVVFPVNPSQWSMHIFDILFITSYSSVWWAQMVFAGARRAFSIALVRCESHCHHIQIIQRNFGALKSLLLT